ncbi:MAG: asparagine synthetase B, partial [Gemmatimonadetes bacterium]|nr:asparagine synthetase B [Gemmatimonadota bacterium]
PPPPPPPPPRPAEFEVLSAAMAFDYATYLRDGLLPKLDRATMLVSLEARAPYLDRDVTSFAFGLPPDAKVRGFTTKWLLKQAAARRLPASVVRRRKRGLSVPISTLINGALRQEVDRLLAPERLRREGLLNADSVGELLKEHRNGSFRLARGIWALVILERWIEEWT